MEAPVFENDALAGFTPGELINLMIEHHDRVPRSVIDECAHRADQMLDALAPLARPDDEREAASHGHWWLRLHAVMILGLIPGEPAGRLLVEFIRHMCREEDDSLQEWFDGYWPALLHNKPHSIIAPLRDICMDRRVYWFMRTNLVDAVIEHAQQQGEAELEQALDWVARIAADENEDWEYRLSIANSLLDFPRVRHRTLFTELAARQSGFGIHFAEADINQAYAQGRDTPKWECFSDPWQFYDVRQIKARQQRWQEEDLEYDIDEAAIDAMLRGSDYYNQKTFRRESPKIGRNDPCPCGSGRKYKKCCLGKQ